MAGKKRATKRAGEVSERGIRREVEEKTGSEVLAQAKGCKASAKASFTKSRIRLARLLETDAPQLEEIDEARKKLEDAEERVRLSLEHLSVFYAKAGNYEAVEQTSEEIEKISQEYCTADQKAQEYLGELRHELNSNKKEGAKETRAMKKQLEQQREEQRLRTEAVKEQRRKLETNYLQQQRLLEAELKRIEGGQDDGQGERESITSTVIDAVDGSEEGPTQRAEVGDCPQGKRTYARSHNARRNNLIEPDSPIIVQADRVDAEYGSRAPELGRDMWRQLQRVAIPTFSGDKRTYSGWKAAFMTCIDQAPATPEYKLLQLRNYLKGEAFKVVENLGHSASAYDAAKERLERKYGGARRQVAINLEELEQCRPVRPGNARDVEKLADLLDVLVINLKEADRHEELGNGSLFIKVQKKLNETMLTDYQRWTYENEKVDNLETLWE